MSESETHGIYISVSATYVADQSPRAQYAFVYDVRIENRRSTPAQLQRRHWIITDGMGKVREVEGEGVIGLQPVLQPGEQFSYRSGAVIATPVGTMRGTYRMTDDSGEVFEAEIPEFMLSAQQYFH